MSTVTVSSFQPSVNWPWGGSTATLRYTYSSDFVDSTGTPVMHGLYKDIACTVAGGVVSVPSHSIISTLDSLVNPIVTLSAQFLDQSGAKRPNSWLFQGFSVPTTTPTTIGALIIFNQGSSLVLPPDSYLNRQEVENLISIAQGTLNDASDVIKGRTKLSVAPVSASNPIAVGDNDERINSPLGVANVKSPAYGALGDGVVLTDGAMTAASAILTSASASFTAADIGKKIDVNGAGAPNVGVQYYALAPLMSANLVGTIISRQSATQVTLSVAAGTTVSGKQVVYGTDDYTAIMAAIASSAGTIFFPAGNYIVGPDIKVVLTNRTLRGEGMNTSVIWKVTPVAYTSVLATNHLLSLNNGSHDVLITDLGFSGTNANGELSSFGVDVADGIFICTGVPNGYAGYCNSNSGLSNVTLDRIRTDHFWGIGIHAPGTGTIAAQQVNNISILNSVVTYNSYDGLNPNIYDGLLISGNRLQHNGTGGLETSTYSGQQIADNLMTFNRLVGAAIGGFAPSVNKESIISGNICSDNGVGITYSGIGMVVNDITNPLIIGNTFERNSAVGLQLTGGAGITGGLVSGNVAANNGLMGAVGIGILASIANLTISGNYVTNDPIAGYSQFAGIEPILAAGVHVINNRVRGHARDYDFNACTSLFFVDSNPALTLASVATSTFIFPAPGPETALTITANTIAPIGQFHSVGAGLIKNITLPLGAPLNAVVYIRPTAAFTTDLTGNIGLASTATIGRTMAFTYDSVTTKWWPSY